MLRNPTKNTALINHPVIRILLIFLVVEGFMVLWAWRIRRMVPDHYPDNVAELYMGVSRETNSWLEPWQRWDTLHYQAIAE